MTPPNSNQKPHWFIESLLTWGSLLYYNQDSLLQCSLCSRDFDSWVNPKAEISAAETSLQHRIYYGYIPLLFLWSTVLEAPTIFYLVMSCCQGNNFSKRSWKGSWEWRVSAHRTWGVHMEPPINAVTMEHVTTIR